jgi:hypothetical protein
MKKLDDVLQAPLTPQETRWASELADRLPEDVDLTFEESKYLTRLPIREWPAELLSKVKDYIDDGDSMIDDQED